MGNGNVIKRMIRRLLHVQAEPVIYETHGFESLTFGNRMILYASDCLLHKATGVLYGHTSSFLRAATVDFNHE